MENESNFFPLIISGYSELALFIQPTQYFQLENVPLFNGAYLIIGVEHSIKPNHMSTEFNGVRILKYPSPIVTEFAKSVLGDGSSVTDVITDDVATNVNNVETSVSADNNPPQARYNSMYDLTI